jgi:hypothetical protein
MENLQSVQSLNWIKVIVPNTGEEYYIPQEGSVFLQNTLVSSAITASYALNSGGSFNTGSLLTTASFADPRLTFTKGDGNAFTVDLSSLTSTSASFASTASYAINHAVITSSYICDGKLNANQSFATGSDAIIAFVDYIDPNSWLTSNQFKPTIAGYYNMSFGAWLNNAGVSSNQVNIQMRKNGGQTMVILQQPLNNGTGISLSGNRVIYMNGTTDYLEWTVFQGAGAGPTGTLLQGTPDGSGTWFSAFLITQ